MSYAITGVCASFTEHTSILLVSFTSKCDFLIYKFL